MLLCPTKNVKCYFVRLAPEYYFLFHFLYMGDERQNK